MKRIKMLKALSLLVLSLVSSASYAQFVKFEFTGHGVGTDVSGGAVSGGPGDYLVKDTLITGAFYYNLSTPHIFYDTDPSGTYAGYTSPTDIRIQFTSNTGYTFAPNSTAASDPLVIINDQVGGTAGATDSIKVVAAQHLSAGINQDVDLTLTDKHNGTIWNNGLLPSTLDLKDFNGTLTLFWGDDKGHSYSFFANIDTLTQVAVVPEPETYAMLLAGLALVGVIRRRKQQA